MLNKILKISFVLIPIFIIFLYFNYYRQNGDEWSVQCQFFKITGFYCPGCGGQRAFDALLHGEFIKAMRFNTLIYLILPFLGYCYILLGIYFIWGKKAIFNKMRLSVNLGYAFLIILLLFFILRNIPIYPFILLHP